MCDVTLASSGVKTISGFYIPPSCACSRLNRADEFSLANATSSTIAVDTNCCAKPAKMINAERA